MKQPITITEMVLGVLDKVVAGYDYNPGSSDLDNEQPIHVSMTMGDYRKAKSLTYHLREGK